MVKIIDKVKNNKPLVTCMKRQCCNVGVLACTMLLQYALVRVYSGYCVPFTGGFMLTSPYCSDVLRVLQVISSAWNQKTLALITVGTSHLMAMLLQRNKTPL